MSSHSNESEEKSEKQINHQGGKEAPNQDTTTWKESPFLLIKGFFMGSADIVPGVSGGTLALILGIYSRLMHAIKSFDKESITALFRLDIRSFLDELHWKFLAVLLTGILAAFLFFTKIVPLQVYMFTDPEIVYGLFFGLIVGSIYFLFRSVARFHYYHLLFVLGGTLIGYWVVTLVPTNTPENPLFVFLSGSIAICAMVLPGISGSYLLLILRKYDYILAQIGRLGSDDTGQALIILAPFILGAIVGIMLFSRLLSWLLDNYHAATLVTLIGFLIGSLYMIWPYQHRQYHETVAKRKIVDVEDPLVKELRENPPNRQRPEYHMLGDTLVKKGDKKMEVLTIKRKLIRSTPYIPYVSESTPRDYPRRRMWKGLGGIVVGFLLVGALERIR